jgi:methionine synthase I (cobalamin-dependent)
MTNTAPTARPALPYRDTRYLDALNERVLVFDGAMGTNIQRYNLTAEDFGGKALEGCNDNLVLTRPDVIQAIHESFLAVGCDVVETCTFQSTPRRLEEWGLGDKVRAINVGAAQLGRRSDRASWPAPSDPRACCRRAAIRYCRTSGSVS